MNTFTTISVTGIVVVAVVVRIDSVSVRFLVLFILRGLGFAFRRTSGGAGILCRIVNYCVDANRFAVSINCLPSQF